MSKVLFICHGNVGRSQIAEAFYNSYTNSNDSISGGTDPYSPYIHKIPGKLIREVMEEKGISLEGKNVKYATKEMLINSERVYVLCKREVLSEEVLNAERFHNKKLIFWEIEDPYDTDLENTRKIRDNIEKMVLSII